MVASSPHAPTTGLIGKAAGRAYFGERRANVDGFVRRHFTWPGTLRLNSAAFGRDILRAPVNVMLSPILVLTRIAGFLCRKVGLRRVADWLGKRRIVLRTSVAERVEALVVTDLLGVTIAADTVAFDHDKVVRAVLAAPQFREMIRKCEDVAEAEALGQRIADAIAEYAGTRSAVADMTTGLCALIIGVIAFNALTPGMISMAPGVADVMARGAAVAAFPLGDTLGGVWFGVFRPGASPALVAGTLAGLVMAGAIVAAFAGLIADPVQSRLGIHQRRLGRLIDTIEAALIGAGDRPFVPREHYYARLLDLWDAFASLFRILRS